MNILDLILNGGGGITVSVTVQDLFDFAYSLINLTKEEEAKKQEEAKRQAEAQKSEVYISKKEALAKLGCCSTTLYNWNKSKYLTASRLGARLRYKLSDVEEIVNKNNNSGKQ